MKKLIEIKILQESYFLEFLSDEKILFPGLLTAAVYDDGSQEDIIDPWLDYIDTDEPGEYECKIYLDKDHKDVYASFTYKVVEKLENYSNTKSLKLKSSILAKLKSSTSDSGISVAAICSSNLQKSMCGTPCYSSTSIATVCVDSSDKGCSCSSTSATCSVCSSSVDSCTSTASYSCSCYSNEVCGSSSTLSCSCTSANNCCTSSTSACGGSSYDYGCSCSSNYICSCTDTGKSSCSCTASGYSQSCSTYSVNICGSSSSYSCSCSSTYVCCTDNLDCGSDNAYSCSCYSNQTCACTASGLSSCATCPTSGSYTSKDINVLVGGTDSEVNAYTEVTNLTNVNYLGTAKTVGLNYYYSNNKGVSSSVATSIFNISYSGDSTINSAANDILKVDILTLTEASYDKLTVEFMYEDTVLSTSTYSGKTSWTTCSYTIPSTYAGKDLRNFKIRCKYTKDGSNNYGADQAWLRKPAITHNGRDIYLTNKTDSGSYAFTKVIYLV